MLMRALYPGYTIAWIILTGVCPKTDTSDVWRDNMYVPRGFLVFRWIQDGTDRIASILLDWHWMTRERKHARSRLSHQAVQFVASWCRVFATWRCGLMFIKKVCDEVFGNHQRRTMSRPAPPASQPPNHGWNFDKWVTIILSCVCRYERVCSLSPSLPKFSRLLLIKTPRFKFRCHGVVTTIFACNNSCTTVEGSRKPMIWCERHIWTTPYPWVTCTKGREPRIVHVWVSR